jgi:quercetin dioxygenase-like cupin family protein
MAKYIKNIDHETVLNLAHQVEILPGQVVSRTLAQNKSVSLTLFAFDMGEEISTHDSKGDALVHVLEGEGTFTVDGKIHNLKAGEALVMPAGKPHSVFAAQAFKMLLTVIFPKEA